METDIQSAGPASLVLDWLSDLGEWLVRSRCDFIRLDMPDIDVAYHRMPAGASRQPLVVISAVSDGPFDAGLHDLARQTAHGAVAECVRDVAPTA